MICQNEESTQNSSLPAQVVKVEPSSPRTLP